MIETPLSFDKGFVLFLTAVAGILLHEAIHGISWAWLDNISRKHIHFGFKWRTMTPYIHCSVPVKVRNYRWGTALPGIILGILPFSGAMLFQHIGLFYFGFLFTVAAGGDFLILWLIRDLNPDAYVMDHPDLIGCRIIDSEIKKE